VLTHQSAHYRAQASPMPLAAQSRHLRDDLIGCDAAVERERADDTGEHCTAHAQAPSFPHSRASAAQQHDPTQMRPCDQ